MSPPMVLYLQVEESNEKKNCWITEDYKFNTLKEYDWLLFCAAAALCAGCPTHCIARTIFNWIEFIIVNVIYHRISVSFVRFYRTSSDHNFYNSFPYYEYGLFELNQQNESVYCQLPSTICVRVNWLAVDTKHHTFCSKFLYRNRPNLTESICVVVSLFGLIFEMEMIEYDANCLSSMPHTQLIQ